MAKSKRQKKSNTLPERQFRAYCITHNIEFVFQKKVSFGKHNKSYDFYLPKYNCLVEVDGNYWHQKDDEVLGDAIQRKNHKNDLLKNFIAEHSGFKLVRIWEDETPDDNLIKNKLVEVIGEL